MARHSYTEMGMEIKHVRYALRIPELSSMKMKKMKLFKIRKPKMFKKKKEIMSRASLDSLNVDWRKEFDQKYADLIFKMKSKKKSSSSLVGNTSMVATSEMGGNMLDFSLLSSSSKSLASSSVSENSLCLDQIDDQHEDLLFLPHLEEIKEKEENFESENTNQKDIFHRRKLRYSYHILKDSEL